MTTRHWLAYALRLMAVAYFGLTAIYGLMYFMPFTYVQLLESELVPELVGFARWHAWLFLPLAMLVDLGPAVGQLSPLAFRLRQGYRVAVVITGLLLLAFPVLPTLQNDLSSFLWAQASLIPLLWLAAIDLAAVGDRLHWDESPGTGETRPLLAAVTGAGFAWVLSMGILALRPEVATALATTELGFAVTWSIGAHLVVFLALATGALVIRGLAALTRRPPRTEALLATAGLVLLVAAALRTGFFAALAFNGRLADLGAATLALAIVLPVVSLTTRIRTERVAPVGDGIILALAPLAPLPERSWPISLAWLGGLAVVGGVALHRLEAVDWNYLLQRLVLMAVWLSAFAACYGAATARRHTVRRLGLATAVPVLALLVLRGVGLVGDHVVFAADGTNRTLVLDRYAGYDVAGGLLAGWVTPTPATGSDDGELYRYLQAYTGIPRSAPLAPKEVRFVPDPSAPARSRPHVFIFVADSLRRDYVGAYNPDVTFTPAIDRLAAEGHVFSQAFTRYGATGLSEPSIWIGGMLPHKQYVDPFAPMNALQTLVRSQGYEGFLGMDPILRKILEPDGWVTHLEDGYMQGGIETCGALTALEGQIARRTTDAPIFVYMRPLDLHIATLSREGNDAVDAADYGPFYAPYASRLRRLDDCFGRFLDFLREAELYDDSVIMVSSDHGDSLGEGGRYGHAYTIFPEVLRVPLIVKTPAGLTTGLEADLNGLAFTTDITPTLHTLMGLSPEDKGTLFGASLYVEDLATRRRYGAADHLVASSYGPVYGVIEDAGRSLYILDTVNYQDHLYDLTTEDLTAALPLSDDRRRTARDKIRALVTELNAWYAVPDLQ